MKRKYFVFISYLRNFIALYSWIIRVNFFFLYFFYHRFLIFPTLFPSKCWTRFHKVYYWTRVVVQFPRRKSSNRLLPALSVITLVQPLFCPLLLAQLPWHVLKKCISTGLTFVIQPEGGEGRRRGRRVESPRRFRGRIKTFRSHLSPPDVYSLPPLNSIRCWIFLENQLVENDITAHASIIEPMISIKEMER